MKSPTKESKEKLDDCQNRFTRKRRSLHGFNRLRMRCYRDHGIHIIEKETLTLLESIRSEENLVENPLSFDHLNAHVKEIFGLVLKK